IRGHHMTVFLELALICAIGAFVVTSLIWFLFWALDVFTPPAIFRNAFAKRVVGWTLTLGEDAATPSANVTLIQSAANSYSVSMHLFRSLRRPESRIRISSAEPSRQNAA